MTSPDKKYYRIPLLVFALLIITGSSIPGKSLPQVFKFTPDKLIHTLEYFILGFLMIRWMFVEFPERSNTYLYRTVIAVGAVFGVFDELYQSLIPGRFTDPFDWMMDFSGVCLAVVIYHFVIVKPKRKKLS